MASLRQTGTDALLDAAFMPRPVFRMGFDAHVKAWGDAVSRECFVRYHTRSDFAAALERRRDALRAIPLPAWGRNS